MGLIDNAKDVAKLVQQIGNMELYEKLVSLQTDAMAMVEENWKLKEESRFLKEEIRKLKEQKEIQETLFFDGNRYYLNKKGSSPEGPFCQVCWDVDRRLVREIDVESDLPFCNYCANHRNKTR